MTDPSLHLLLGVATAWFVIAFAAQLFGWLSLKRGLPVAVAAMVTGVASLASTAYPPYALSAEAGPR